jgi:hypothetical protein
MHSLQNLQPHIWTLNHSVGIARHIKQTNSSQTTFVESAAAGFPSSWLTAAGNGDTSKSVLIISGFGIGEIFFLKDSRENFHFFFSGFSASTFDSFFEFLTPNIATRCQSAEIK